MNDDFSRSRNAAADQQDDAKPSTENTAERPYRDFGERTQARPEGDRPAQTPDRPRYGERSERSERSDRAPRSYGDRPERPRSFGDRPTGDRPGGDRPDRPRSFDRPTDRSDRPRSYGDRPSGDRPDRPRSFDRPADRSERPRSYGDRPQGDRPARPEYADRDRSRSFGDRPSGDRPDRPRSFDRPADRSERPRSYGDRPQGDRPARPEYADRDRPRSYGDRPSGDRPARPRSFDRPADRSERPRSYGDRPQGDRPARPEYADRDRPRSYGDRPQYGERSERPERSFDRAPRGDADRPRRTDRPDRPAQGRFGERAQDRPNRNSRGGPVGAIIDIDRELLTLIARRSRFLARLRDAHGNILAPTEKTLRTAWQDGVVEHSRDPRLSRDMFLLLQEIEVNAEEEEKRPAFTLNPSTKAIAAQLPAPLSSRQCRILALLAASSGQALVIANAPKDDASVDMVKTLHQAGADIAFVAEKGLVIKAGKPLSGFADRIFHSGDDVFNFFLLSSYMVGRPANVKFTGGREMRLADLSALRHFLPALGVRLTTVVPKTEGLPVRIECSNMLPPEVTIPAELAADNALALLVGAATWDQPVCFDLSAHPQAAGILAEASELFALAQVKTQQEDLRYTVHGGYQLPEYLQPAIDLVVASSLLTLPAFVGGELTLTGNWPQTPQAEAARAMLEAAGLDCHFEDNALHTVKSTRPVQSLPELPQELAPLGLAIQAFGAAHGECVATVDPELDAATVAVFLSHIGLEKNAQGELVAERVASQPEPWITPSAVWGMAFALASFTRPGLKMLNPGLVTASVPTFWTIFNTLPNPIQEKPKVVAHGKAPRRRVMAGDNAGTSAIRNED